MIEYHILNSNALMDRTSWFVYLHSSHCFRSTLVVVSLEEKAQQIVRPQTHKVRLERLVTYHG